MTAILLRHPLAQQFAHQFVHADLSRCGKRVQFGDQCRVEFDGEGQEALGLIDATLLFAVGRGGAGEALRGAGFFHALIEVHCELFFEVGAFHCGLPVRVIR